MTFLPSARPSASRTCATLGTLTPLSARSTKSIPVCDASTESTLSYRTPFFGLYDIYTVHTGLGLALGGVLI